MATKEYFLHYYAINNYVIHEILLLLSNSYRQSKILVKLHPIFKSTYIYPLWRKIHTLSLRGLNYSDDDFYTNGELNLIKSIIKKSPDKELIIFDAGANIGEFSLLVADLCETYKKTCRIFAFEPMIENIKQLRHNTSKVRNISIIEKALGEISGHIDMYTTKEIDSQASIYASKKNSLAKTQVQVTTLDEFCLMHKIDIIHYLKIDTEGHELPVLKGARALLNQSKIRCIQFEFGGTMVNSRVYVRDFYQFLSKYNYKTGRIFPNAVKWTKSYNLIEEIFMYSNYCSEPI